MLIFDASALLALLSDIDRPDLVRMLAETHKVLVVPSGVDAEIIDHRARAALDRLAGDGRVAVLRVNADEEIHEFRGVHRGTGEGEADVILACQKIASDGGAAVAVLDDRKGRAAAKGIGVRFTGLAGLLMDLKDRGVLGKDEYAAVIRSLRSSRFRLPRSLQGPAAPRRLRPTGARC